MVKDLILSAQKGDLQAFKLLVERHQNYVYTLVYRVVKNQQDAEEVSQDVFLKIYTKLDTFNHQSKFTSWLYAIAIRTAIDRKRKMARNLDSSGSLEKRHEQFIEPKTADASLTQNTRKEFVQQAINDLPEDDALLITLFYFKELSIQEICDLLSLNNNNVKIKLFRARKNLKKKIEHILKDELNSIL